MSVTIIADIGSNHRGKLDLALKSVQVAKDCGADVVKFQLYSEIELYGIHCLTDATNPKTCTLSHEELVARGSIRKALPGQMPRDWLKPVAKECARVGIEFMCTAFSPEGVVEVDPYVKRHKLASSEFPHVGIIDAMVKTGKPMLVSTGGIGQPDLAWLFDHLWSRMPGGPDLSLLECVAKYPAPADLYDVTVLHNWADGISDHTFGSAVACAAVGAGAIIIEKHLDPFPAEGSTPDSGFALGPTEFRMYVQDVREAASAVGDGVKNRKGQHEYALRWMRRYIVTQPIAEGEAFRYGENFGIYRSLKDDTRGLSPITMPLERLNGRSAKCALQPGDSIGPGEIG
jgi:sialic acid synthase SpsE